MNVGSLNNFFINAGQASLVLLVLLKIEVGASSNGEGRGDEEESAEEEEEEEDDDDAVEDEEESPEDESLEDALAAAELELSRATTVPPTSNTAFGFRLTRSNCLVKCVTVIGACRSSGTNCTSCSTSAVQEGIVGDDAGAAAATTAGCCHSSGCCSCCWATAPATSTVMMPARSDMAADWRLCDAEDGEEDIEGVDPDRRRLRQQRAVRVEDWQLGVVVPLAVEECETRFTMTLGGDAVAVWCVNFVFDFSSSGGESAATARGWTADDSCDST